MEGIMNKPIKDHTSTKTLSGITLLLLVVNVIKPWEVSGEVVVFFLVWSAACWLYIEDMYDKDFRIYNLQVSKMGGQSVPVLQEGKDVIATKKNSHIVRPRSDLLADDWECYKRFMYPTVEHSVYEQPINTTEFKIDIEYVPEHFCICEGRKRLDSSFDFTGCVESGGYRLKKEGVLLSERCLFHGDWLEVCK